MLDKHSENVCGFFYNYRRQNIVGIGKPESCSGLHVTDQAGVCSCLQLLRSAQFSTLLTPEMMHKKVTHKTPKHPNIICLKSKIEKKF